MRNILLSLITAFATVFRSRLSLAIEILALRHQLSVLRQYGKRTRIKVVDRLFWVWLSKIWSGWRDTVVFVKPSTVIAWQRKRFRDHWAMLSQRGKLGRPALAQ